MRQCKPSLKIWLVAWNALETHDLNWICLLNKILRKKTSKKNEKIHTYIYIYRNFLNGLEFQVVEITQVPKFNQRETLNAMVATPSHAVFP